VIIPYAGTSRLSIGCAYVLLSSIDIFAIYHEIRSVVFTMLNYERSYLLACDHVSTTTSTTTTSSSTADNNSSSSISSSDERSRPPGISRRENIFLSSKLAPEVFRTVSATGIGGAQLDQLAKVFAHERYLLCYTPQRGLSVVLRRRASGPDILKSLLALSCLEQQLQKQGLPQRHRLGSFTDATSSSSSSNSSGDVVAAAAPAAAAVGDRVLEWSEVYSGVVAAQAQASSGFDGFMHALHKLGWNTDKFMFGNIRCRADWDAEP
jgi:hypothetical protein